MPVANIVRLRGSGPGLMSAVLHGGAVRVIASSSPARERSALNQSAPPTTVALESGVAQGPGLKSATISVLPAPSGPPLIFHSSVPLVRLVAAK